MFELELLTAEGGVAVRFALGPAPLYLGRAPNNDVVVVDNTVSGRHLAAWASSGRVFVEDLNSRNGTFVGGHRIRRATRVAPDDEIRAGTNTRLRVVRVKPGDVTSARGVLALEDLDAGVRYPLREDRFPIGDATLLIHDNGEVWLGTDDAQTELSVDDPFEADGRRMCIRVLSNRVSVTREVGVKAYPYVLRADLDAPGGPEATLEDPHASLSHRVTGETRAVLLYLLGRQRERDLAAGADPEVAGWCDDADVTVGIWGKGDPKEQLGKLNVLLCRVRKELRRAGFDPWFLEKRRGAVRARVREARVG